MDDFKGVYNEKKRKGLIKEEFDKLVDIFGDVDAETAKQVERLCHEAAFVRVMLTELRETIVRDGYIERYQNGANQSGLKRSPAVEIYEKELNQYMKLIAQLNKYLPDNRLIDQGRAEIMAFVQGGLRNDKDD